MNGVICMRRLRGVAHCIGLERVVQRVVGLQKLSGRKEEGRDESSDEEVEQAIQRRTEVRWRLLMVWARDPERALHMSGEKTCWVYWFWSDRKRRTLRGSRLWTLGDTVAMDQVP